MDDFGPFDADAGDDDLDGSDFHGDFASGAESPDLDAFDEAEVPGDDLDAFDFDEAEDLDDLDEGFMDEAGAVEAEYDEPAGEDESAYAATYEDLLLSEADNPPGFPPELDLDVPEPVDGYPWVDLDVMGTAESEPWVNGASASPVDASEYALADIDDPAPSALARFWQQ